MAIPPFPQSREGQLAAWCDSFSTAISAAPTTMGLTAGQATAFAALNATFQAAYAAATNTATNSKAAIEAKNDAKAALMNSTGGARQLVDIIQAFPGTTNEMRAELNLRIRDVEPTPIPAPTTAPDVDIVSAVGRTVTVRLHDPSIGRRGKPFGVRGASVYSYVGVEPPDDIESWKYHGSSSKTTIEVDFPTTVAGGSTVWFTAYWVNAKLEAGPPAAPVSTFLPGGLAQAA